MKKVIYRIASIGVGLIIQFIFLLLYIIFTLYNAREIDYVYAMTFAIVLAILLSYPTIWGMNYLNRLYDGREGKSPRKMVSKRWSMVSVFFAIVLVSILLLIDIASDIETSPLKRDTAYISIVIGIVCLVLATLAFSYNYQNYLPRKKRIESMLRLGNLFYRKRRYTFLIEKVIDESHLVGRLIGELHKNDLAYLINPAMLARSGHITSMLVNGKEVKEAKDEEVELVLETFDKDYVPQQFGIITSVNPELRDERYVHAENPRLTSMIDRYNDYNSDNTFMSTLVYDACHSRYIVPAILSANDFHKGDIMDPLLGRESVSFLAVATEGSKTDNIIPIFTDWAALSSYKEVMNSDEAVSVVLSFQEIIRIMHASRYTGIVLNPFGPKPFYFSKEYIDHITSLDSYKEEFLYPQDDKESE